MTSEKTYRLDSFDVIAFDLDDTLTESKSPLSVEMAELLGQLLKQKKVAVTSGASFAQFQKQFLAYLKVAPADLENLYLLPTCGASLYEYKGNWQPIYTQTLAAEDKQKIFAAFEVAFQEINFPQPEKIYGLLLEDRETQITFSGLGSEAPLKLKKTYDPDRQKREELVGILQRELPDFAVAIGGSTSIDVTKKGIDKAYGLKQLIDHLDFSLGRVVYVGDQLSPQGNDAPVLNLGVRCWPVTSAQETEKLIRGLFSRY